MMGCVTNMNNLNLLFQGDSITDCGRDKELNECNRSLGMGYVTLIASRLLCDYPGCNIYNKGVSGNRIADMYARWQEDALNIPFNVISILNGINDVGFGLRLNCGASAEKYKFVYDRILYETKEAKPDADIILCQPFIVKRHFESEFGDDIYNNWEKWESEIINRGIIVRELADKYNCTYVPFFDAIKKALLMAPAEHWSTDCVHLTPAGHEILARTWLETAMPVLRKYLK